MPSYKNRKCHFHEQKIEYIDYKNVRLLRKFISQYNKIVPRYYTGTCLKHQKKLTSAIKNARVMGLISFTK